MLDIFGNICYIQFFVSEIAFKKQIDLLERLAHLLQ